MNRIGFLIIFAIYASLNFYIFTRGRQALPKNSFVQTAYFTLFLVCSLSFFIAMLFEKKMPFALNTFFEITGGFWMIYILYFLVVVLFADILRLTDHFLHIFPQIVKANFAQVKLIYFGLVFFILILFSIIGYINFNNPKTVKHELDFSNGSSKKEHLSVLAVSDVHLGTLIGKSRLKKYVDLINKQKPDIIFIVGDLFDRNMHSVEVQKMDVLLKQLNATYGVYAVLGNHDYFVNVQNSLDYMARSGIKVLRDSAVVVDDKFVLIGRDDHSNHRRKPIQAILEGIDKNLPLILLDHQPVNLNEAVENNIDLQISGHTHNGQIYPINLLVGKMFNLAYGFRKTGNTNFYVSSGLGLWGAPIRLGSQSELVNFQFVLSGK